MTKSALAIATFALFGSAIYLDWRAAGLMICAWWGDNLLKGLLERDRG